MMALGPEIDIPGHASALLAAVPELGAGPGEPPRVAADWGILPHLISPLPGTMRFLEVVFAELLQAIPAGYVHIGGRGGRPPPRRPAPRARAPRPPPGPAPPRGPPP